MKTYNIKDIMTAIDQSENSSLLKKAIKILLSACDDKPVLIYKLKNMFGYHETVKAKKEYAEIKKKRDIGEDIVEMFGKISESKHETEERCSCEFCGESFFGKDKYTEYDKHKKSECSR
jgi:hypothetical protein